MSHFSVTVCLKDPGQYWRERLSDALAPYGENLEAAPYRDYCEGGPAGYWAVKALREHEGLNPDDATLTWQQVAEARNRRYPDEHPLLVAEDGRAYAMSTRNPQAKWDYWRVGGRWGGYFPYLATFAHEVVATEHGWDSPERVKPLTCDGGPKRALDLGKLRDVKATEAWELYAEYQQVVAGTPEALPWSVFADNISDGNGYTADQARTEYHAQPRVERLDRHETFKWHDDPIAKFAVSETLYVERARAQAVPGFATLTTDGRWMAPGYMGWFAVTDATDDTRAGYCEAANAYIGSLSGDDWLIAVDCHI